MLPHVAVHSGREKQRRTRCEGDFCKRMSSQAESEFGDGVCGRGCDQKQGCSVSKVDVDGFPVGAECCGWTHDFVA